MAQNYFSADECAEWAGQKPRKDEFFFPLEKSARAVVDWFKSEHAAARDDADVFDTHCFARHPLGDFHFVGQANWANFCVAQERRADSASLVRDEANGDGVVHPINMAFDWLDNLPDLFGGGINFYGDFDHAHR